MSIPRSSTTSAETRAPSVLEVTRPARRRIMRQYELAEKVSSYDRNTDENLLNKAYVFAMQMHGGATRASGDPYFSHPVEVAGILADLKLDYMTVIAGLLHDTVEDTSATVERIEAAFGQDIARLVDGVTKLNLVEFDSQQSRQAESFRKFVVAMAEDIRVLLVKLADRLHNMRTLHHVPDTAKRARIAVETLEIYAPLAERIGMQTIQTELEDLAFRHAHPQVYDSVRTRLEYLSENNPHTIEDISRELTRACCTAGIEVRISGRIKSPYAIWTKMQRKNVPVEQLSDIVAFRMILPDHEDCYRALGIMHRAYRMLPGRFKDFISTPKPNGYRSLHTVVIIPKSRAVPMSRTVELQIRTEKMHQTAEFGVAAHWSYKLGINGGQDFAKIQEELRALEQTSENSQDLLDNAKLQMYPQQICCFTPKGRMVFLPGNATPIDFAYAVHTEVGDTCVSARINGVDRRLSTTLRNGDQVEIITSTTSAPKPFWEGLVQTGRARSAIRRHIRQQERGQFSALGSQLVDRVFLLADLPRTAAALETARITLGFDTVEDVLVEVGSSTIMPEKVLQAAFPGRQDSLPVRRTGTGTVPITGLTPGVAVHYAHCCHPLPGERIVGIMTTGKGVTIHTIDCETLEGFQSMPEKWIDVAWELANDADLHVGRLRVVLANAPGSLGVMSTIIGQNDGNIINLKIPRRSEDFFDLLVDVEVRDIRHLTHIIAALRASPVITSIERDRDEERTETYQAALA